jgi:hypothetical protein
VWVAPENSGVCGFSDKKKQKKLVWVALAFLLFRGHDAALRVPMPAHQRGVHWWAGMENQAAGLAVIRQQKNTYYPKRVQLDPGDAVARKV